jgi:hypothetical protein
MTVPAGAAAVKAAEPPPHTPAAVQEKEPRRSKVDESDDDRPRRSSRRDDDEDDDRPRRSSRRREDDEDDDRPRRSSRRREDDEADDDDRSRRRGRKYKDDDDDDYDRRRGSREKSGKATASLVLAVASFFVLGPLLSIPAIILGILGRKEVARSRGRMEGKGTATAGIVIGSINVAIIPLALIFLVFAVGKVREAASRIQSQNNLRQMGLAMHNYAAETGSLPQAVPDAKLGAKTKLSWRVQILPYVEAGGLYQQLHHNEPWDSPHNRSLLTSMPMVFHHPLHPEENAKGLTYYRVFTGEHTLFPQGRLLRFPAGIPDGTSNTLLIVEAAEPIEWTRPDELVYDPNKPLPKIGGHFKGKTLAVMADGSFKILTPNISEKTMRSAIDPADNMPLGPDWFD